MATIVKLDIKTDLEITLDDFNKNGHLGTFEVPTWAQDLYVGKTDEEIFDDFTAAIYNSFAPIIGEQLVWIYTANNQYFNSDKIKENVRLAMYQEVSNWMLNVPMEVKNNVNFSAQAGFSFSLSIQPWLINYDEFNIKTRTYLQETGLVGISIEDLDGLELWVKPAFRTGEALSDIDLRKKDGEDETKLSIGTTNYVDERIQFYGVNSHKKIRGERSVLTDAEADGIIADYNAGTAFLLDDGTSYSKAIAVEGDVIFFVEGAAGTSGFKTEETLILGSLEMVKTTSRNADGKKLDDVVIKADANASDILALEADLSLALTRSDTTSVLSPTNQVVMEQELTSEITRVESKTDANTIDVSALKGEMAIIQPEVDGHNARIIDYENSKASFVTIADVLTTETIDLKDVAVTDGVIAWPAVTTFTDAIKAELKLTKGDDTIYVYDSFNDGTGTVQSINLDGASTNVRVEITATGATFLDDAGNALPASSLAYLGTYVASSVSQIGAGNSVGTGIDALARTEAAAAKIVANTADALSKANEIKIDAIDITGKQDTNDASLTTTSKNIVGAIKELKSDIDTESAKTVGITYVGGETLIDGESLHLDDTDLKALETKLGI